MEGNLQSLIQMSGNFAGRFVGRAQRIRRDPRGRVALGPRLQIGLQRQNLENGFVVDRFTANRPLTDQDFFDTIRQVEARLPPAARRTAYYRFRFQGILPQDFTFRSIRGGQFRTVGALTRAFGDIVDREVLGSLQLGLDETGETYTLDRTTFDVTYGLPVVAPDFFACEEGFGDPPLKTLPKIPIMRTFSEDLTTASHCFDKVCYWLGIPYYSLEHGPLPPVQAEGMKYLKSALTAKYGFGSPMTTVHTISPWRVDIARFEVRDLIQDYGKAHPDNAAPDEFLVMSGEIRVALQPFHVWRLLDEDRELDDRGPVLLAVHNNHVEYVPTVYNDTIKSWVPILREPGRYFVNRLREVFYMEPSGFNPRPEESRRLPLPPFVPMEVMYDDETGEAFNVNDTVHHYWKQYDEAYLDKWDKAMAKKREETGAPCADAKVGFVQKKFTQVDRWWKVKKVMGESALERSKVAGKGCTIYYDFETVYKLDGELKPYSCSYLIIDDDERDTRLVGAPEDRFTTEELEDRAAVLLGGRCAEEFAGVVKELALHRVYETITLTGFNSAKFDAFLFMEGVDADSPISEVRLGETKLKFLNHFFMGGGLVGGKLQASRMSLDAKMGFYQEGDMIQDGISPSNIRLGDMAKHLPGMSLASACKAFNTPHQKVGDFDHTEVQAMYERYASHDGDLSFIDDWVGFRAKLENYNKYDVISLAELEASYRLQLYKVTKVVKPTEALPMTAGSVCLAHWKLDLEERVLPNLDTFVKPAGRFDDGSDWPGEDVCSVFGMWEPLDVDAWCALRTGVVGGRVQLPNGPMEVKEPVSSMDVTSLYPWVMVAQKDTYFPCGRVIKLPVGSGPSDLGEVLGVYNVDVDQTRMVENGYPTLVPRKEYSPSGALLRNNWDAPVVYDAWITTPTLVQLLQWGGGVTYRGGYEWTHKIRNIDLFDALKNFLKEKKRQDQLPAGHPEKNKALRSLMKLMANATYGQTLKGIFERSVTSVTPYKLAKMFEEEAAGKIKSINVIQQRGKRVFVDFTYSTESRLKKQGPFVVGAFVLGYSRRYLAQMAARIPPRLRFYYDTDSCKTLWSEKLRLASQNRRVNYWPELLEDFPGYADAPEIGGSEVGCWTEEFPEDNTGIVILFKKGYVGVGADGKSVALEGGQPILSLKGVRKNDAILNVDVRQFLLDFAKRGKTEEHQQALFEALREIANNGTTVGDNPVGFFRSILNNRVGYVVGSVLSRIASNSRRGVSLADTARHSKTFGYIFQTFRVKKLAIHPPQPEEEVVSGKQFDLIATMVDHDGRPPANNAWDRYQAWLHRDVLDPERLELDEAVRAQTDHDFGDGFYDDTTNHTTIDRDDDGNPCVFEEQVGEFTFQSDDESSENE